LCSALVRAGGSVEIVTTDDNGPGRLEVSHNEPIEQDGVVYRYFPRATHFYTFCPALKRWLHDHIDGYDLIHVHALFSHPSITGCRTAQRRDIPYLIRPLGTLDRWGRSRRATLKKISLAALERRLVRGAAAVQFTSEKERVESEEIVSPRRSVVIPNAVPLYEPVSTPAAIGAQFPRLEGRRFVLFLSRIDPKKGLDVLLEAYEAIALQGSADLVIAGDGDPRYLEKLRRLADNLGLTDRIHWVGFVNGSAKSTLLAKAEMLVLPSRSENFGIAVAEALASGTPVVVSDRVALAEEIERAGAGLVTTLEANEVAEAMGELLASQEKRQQMSGAARRLSARFAPDRVAAEVKRLYESILGSG
ncbi:MAG: glycosyltransferase, partial [Actinomycetota bacterium]|nr:glycosyltransferase [Actinomycetota bacterium]